MSQLPIAPMPTVERWSREKIDLALMKWQKAKQVLDAAKAEEMELRKQIVYESGMFNPNVEKGTLNFELGGGYGVKAVKKLDYKIENKEGEAFSVLHQMEKLGESSARMAKELFSFDANLRLSIYEKLTAEEKQLVDSILTTKPAAPTLELIEPKAK